MMSATPRRHWSITGCICGRGPRSTALRSARGRSLACRDETNARLLAARRLELCCQGADILGNEADRDRVVALPRFELLDPSRKVFMCGQQFTEFHKCPHDQNAHLHRAMALQYRREHGHAVFGESKRRLAKAHAGVRI